ncbi:MAG TPA: hypothetical protein VNZ06_00155 [Steroidobacteraceae bacterium]|nr:hypothetical protein [Steroidobacteraceae bacterium]
MENPEFDLTQPRRFRNRLDLGYSAVSEREAQHQAQLSVQCHHHSRITVQQNWHSGLGAPFEGRRYVSTRLIAGSLMPWDRAA